MRRKKQAGYSLLMVVFMVATIIILVSAAAPNLLTQGRREREAETIWRGEQYERAIGLYFKKFGRYPTKIEDLTKQTNGVRFLRQAYTDPNNKEDGTWRFIYVGPNGQLIGSLMHTSLLQTGGAAPAPPGGSLLGGILGIGGQSSNVPGAGGAGASGPGGPASGPGQGGTQGGAQGGTQDGAQGGAQAGQQTNTAASPNPLESQPQPLDGAVLGGNIGGVASKIKQDSLRVYKGGDTYQKWEFIWSPTQQVGIPGQTPVNPNTPGGAAAPGANGATGVPGTPGGAGAIGGPGMNPQPQQPTPTTPQ